MTAIAQSTESEPASESTEIQQAANKEIQFSDLPETIQIAFQGSDYAEWEIVKVQEITNEEGIKYEITVSDGSVEEVILLDEDGNVIEQEN